jgi:Domain of unknown function (DUF4279)
MTTESTLRESDDGRWFRFSATLRIIGDIGDLDRVSAEMGVAPSHAHRRGEVRRPGRFYDHDQWSYTPPVPEDEPLSVHLEALWQVVQPRLSYLKRLKERLTVDVFCGYNSNSCTSGFVVEHRALIIFTELEVPFGVSVVVF